MMRYRNEVCFMLINIYKVFIDTKIYCFRQNFLIKISYV